MSDNSVVHNGRTFTVTLRRVKISPLPGGTTRPLLLSMLEAAGQRSDFRSVRVNPNTDWAELTFDNDAQCAAYLAAHGSGFELQHPKGVFTINSVVEVEPDRVADRLASREQRRATAPVRNPFGNLAPPPSGPAGAPWYGTPYDVQLEAKLRSVRQEFGKCIKSLRKALAERGTVPEWVDGPLAYPLFAGATVRPSPVTERYRNSVNYCIGMNEEDQVTVGSFLPGVQSVEFVDNMLAPELAGSLAHVVTKYLRECGATAFSKMTHTGDWRSLRIRIPTLATDAPILVSFVAATTTPADQIIGAAQAVAAAAAVATARELRFSWIVYDGSSDWAPTSPSTFRHIDAGASTIEECPADDPRISTHEILHGIKFRISPGSFFQVNSVAASALYKDVADAAIEGLKGSTETILDVCCGTGTIGCITASIARAQGLHPTVAGVDIVESAIADAKTNAKENGLEDVTKWYAGDARVLLPGICNVLTSEAVAIVDPPRAGLSKPVLEALRASEHISRIVYVSCNPASLVENLVDLFHPCTCRRRGFPFAPVAAWALDQFPHSDHVEAVVVLERTAGSQGELSDRLKAVQEAHRPDWIAAREVAKQRWQEAEKAKAGAARPAPEAEAEE